MALLATMPSMMPLKTSPRVAANMSLKQQDLHIKSLDGLLCIDVLLYAGQILDLISVLLDF